MLCRKILIPSRPNGSTITREIKNATNICENAEGNIYYMFRHPKWSRFKYAEKYQQEIITATVP